MSEFKISWDNFDRHMSLLVNDVHKYTNGANHTFNKILYLPRGGMVPASVMAHRLGITNVKQIVEDGVEWDLLDPQTLVVDDILDTGESIARLIFKLTHRCGDRDLKTIENNLMVKSFFAFPYIRQTPHVNLPEPQRGMLNSVREFVRGRSFHGIIESSDKWLIFPWETRI